ncbi:hypothetical protein BT96DRAFT_417818 [Gymnopus androsaceus JB14]|uniref:Uncharacterized protein n=1 Tax=Gymnopus androsaceus JB14 TaxID=1447944 RepID=A0A6A4I5Q1_9AGAR|nr:hypothetical protein BT96DRAFT_417818 [Gymnopus androsaceus JB14]
MSTSLSSSLYTFSGHCLVLLPSTTAGIYIQTFLNFKLQDLRHTKKGSEWKTMTLAERKTSRRRCSAIPLSGQSDCSTNDNYGVVWIWTSCSSGASNASSGVCLIRPRVFNYKCHRYTITPRGAISGEKFSPCLSSI